MAKFTYEGVEYNSKTACGVHLVQDLKMKVKEAAGIVGTTYHAIYLNLDSYKDKRKVLLAKYQAKRLMTSKRKHSRAEISRRTNISEKTLKKMFTTVDTSAIVEPTVEAVTETSAQ